MPSQKPDTPPAAADEGLSLERIVFFSDAVMAIAITLLAIDLKIPELTPPVSQSEVISSLLGMGPRFLSFFVSFVVVGVYWTSHHRYFRYIKRYDGMLIVLNLLFLLFIALMPFVASLLGMFGFMPIGVITYAASVAATGFAISGLWWYASSNHRLVDKNLDERFIQTRTRIALVVPLLFLVSIPFALINPFIPMVIWWASPLISVATLRMTDRNRTRQRAKGSAVK